MIKTSLILLTCATIVIAQEHCTLQEPTLDEHPSSLAVGFHPQLQLDITNPSNGQVLHVTNGNNVIEFTVLLSPGIHRKRDDDDIQNWNAYAKGRVEICFNLDDTGFSCLPYENPGGMALPTDLEEGWHEIRGKIIESDVEGNEIGYTGCRHTANNEAVVRFFALRRSRIEPILGLSVAEQAAICDSGCFTQKVVPEHCKKNNDVEIIAPRHRSTVHLTKMSFQANINVRNAGNFTWRLSDSDDDDTQLGNGIFTIKREGTHELAFNFRQASLFRSSAFEAQKIIHLAISRDPSCLESNIISFYVDKNDRFSVDESYYNYDKQLKLLDQSQAEFIVRRYSEEMFNRGLLPVHVVTAADDAYFDRLANLIGSLHYWGGDFLIHVHDIGLSPRNKRLARGWKNVLVHDVDFALLPDHFSQIPLAAFKAYLIISTRDVVAEDGRSILMWIDANTEVRRPLWSIVKKIEEDGYFLTLAGHKFPTYQTVRNQTLRFFDIDLQGELPLVDECTSAIMGYDIESPVFDEIVGGMNRCAWDLMGCHYPPDSNFANQKRDQSALNSVIFKHNQAAKEENSKVFQKQKWNVSSSMPKHIVCSKEEIYWAYATQDSLRVTDEASSFNDIIFYSRRGVPPMPYISKILPFPPKEVQTNETTNVHLDL